MNNNPIGILDSGVGGLTIWKEIVKELPDESTVYIADSIRCPYGTKEKEEIYELSRRLVTFLLEQNAKAIVIACNTITVTSLDQLRREFTRVPIIGTVPVVKSAAKISKNKRIGILSTEATAKSDYQTELIEKFASDCQVVTKGTNEIVPFIEAGRSEDESLTQILERVLKPFQAERVDTLALGCSHFPFVRGLIQTILGGQVTILDSGGAIGRQVRRVLQKEDLSGAGPAKYSFFTTGDDVMFTTILSQLTGKQEENMVQSVHSLTL